MAWRAYDCHGAWRFMVCVTAGGAMVGVTLGSRAERTRPETHQHCGAQPSMRPRRRRFVEGTLTTDAQALPDSTSSASTSIACACNNAAATMVVDLGVGQRTPSEARSECGGPGAPFAPPPGCSEPARYLDPGVPDHRLGLARRGILSTGTVKSPVLIDVVRRGSWIDEAAAAIGIMSADHAAHRSAGAVRKPLPSCVAVLIGDRTGLDPADEERCEDAGTYHVIAISGGTSRFSRRAWWRSAA